jgi:hypothetical protein
VWASASICVGAGLVVFEFAHKFGVDANRACDHRHDVVGESTGLVGADDRRVGHHLAGAQDTHQEVFFRHPLGGECQSKSYSQWETFWNGDWISSSCNVLGPDY